MPTIQLTKTNKTYCSNPAQAVIAKPATAEVTVSSPTIVDVATESVWRSTLTPTVTGVESLVNCSASVVAASTNVSVTGSTVGAGSLVFTLNDGDGGVSSSTLTLDFVAGGGAALNFYSGTQDLGTQANPAISPFGTHAIAGVADVDPKLLLSELYVAQWDFGSASTPDITTGARVARNSGNPVSADEFFAPLISEFIFTVPDGQGLTEFQVTVTITGPNAEQWQATKSVWVIDQQSHYAAADTIYVSNTLTLTEGDFVAAGAIAGATYQAAPPAFDGYDQKRVLFYGQDVFLDGVYVGLGCHGYSVGSFGVGRAELAGGLTLDCNDNFLTQPTTGSTGVKDDDIVNGFANNTRITSLRVPVTSFGMSYDHRTVYDLDGDYSNLTAPDTVSGRISFSPTITTAYDPASGITPANVPYPTGVYVGNSSFIGSSALTICAGTSSDGNMFDFVGGTTVISYDYDSVTYSPSDVVILPDFGSFSIAANGDYDVSAPDYAHSKNEHRIDVLTDDGVKTFYTGQCRPNLNMSIMGVEAFGIGIICVRLRNTKEHNTRAMGNSLLTFRDCSMEGGSEMIEKHAITLRTLAPNTLNPTTPIPTNTGQVYSGQIPFGSGFINSWGGTPRADYVNGNKYGNDCAYWVLAHNHTTTLKVMTGGSASAIQLTSAVNALDGDQNVGIRDVVVYGTHNTTDEPSDKSQFTTQPGDHDIQRRVYLIGWTQDGTTTEYNFQDTIIRDRDDNLAPYYRDPTYVVPTI